MARAPLARPTDAPPTRAPRADADAAPPATPAPTARSPDRLLADRGAAAPRRDHHGRQPALGTRPRPRRARGPCRRRRGHPRAPPPRGPPRRPDALAVRLQPRELGPLRRRGRRPVRPAGGRRSASETDELRAQGVRVRLLGRLEELPAETRRSIDEALRRPPAATRLLLNIAFNYAGRTELVDAVRALVARGRRAGRRSTRQPSSARCTRPACPTPTSSSAPAASSACQQLPDLAVRLRGALLLATRCGRTSGPTRFDARPAEFARRHPPVRPLGAGAPTMRSARSAPPSSSRPARRRLRSAARGIAGRRRVVAVARGDARSFTLLRRPGYPVAAAARASCLAVVVVLDAAFVRSCPAAAACCSWRSGIVARRRRRVHRIRTRATGSSPGWRRVVRRAVRGPARVRAPPRRMPPRRARRRAAARRLGAGAWLDPAAGPRGLGVRHGRVPRRAASSGARKFLTHISPSKTYAGLVGGVVASTVVVAVILWASARPRSARSSSGR